MTETDLVNVSAMLGMKTSTVDSPIWYRPETIHMLILESDANLYYNPLNEVLAACPGSDMMILKYSPLVLVSSPINSFSYDTTTNTILVSAPLGTAYSIKKIREPKIGDKIVGYSDSAQYASIISAVEWTYDKKIKITLADKTLVNAISAGNSMKYFCVLQETAYVYLNAFPYNTYVEESLTDYPADIYIGIDHVVGFDLNKSIGSITL